MNTLCAILVLTLTGTVFAAPGVTFPINSQVPPVASPSQPFVFTFLDTTFVSSQGSLSYSLGNPPSWLCLDSSSRTFSGTPGSDNQGPVNFQLIATDSTGSTPMDITLIVSDASQPEIGAPLLQQLEQFGRTSSPDAFLLYPLQPFSITFSPESFSGTSSQTAFYAISGDNSPLPSWIVFNAQSLEFSGSGPSLVSPTAVQQFFAFKLVASNTPGFTGAVQSFQIAVGYDVLAFNTTFQTLEAVPGQSFNSAHFRDELMLDGKPVQASDLASVEANLPSWLTLDQQTISLSGTPPLDATNQNITIMVVDIHGDTANTTVNLQLSALFTTSLSPVNATIGQDFNYTFSPQLLSSSDVKLNVDLGNSSSWLSYGSKSMTLNGQVPGTILPETNVVTLTAVRGTVSQEMALDIRLSANTVVKASSIPSQTSPQSKSSASILSKSDPVVASSSTSTVHAQSSSGTSRHRTKVILLAVLIPLVLLMALFILCCCCLRRRRRVSGKKRPLSPEDRQISRPIVDPEPSPEMEEALPRSVTYGSLQRQVSNLAPQLDLNLSSPWKNDSIRQSKQRMRRSKRVSDQESTLVDAVMGSLVLPDADRREEPRGATPSSRLGYGTENQNATLFATGKVPSRKNTVNFSKNRAPFRPIQPRTRPTSGSKRSSRAMSGLSMKSSGLSRRSSGLPLRLSGAGHGSGGYGPPGFNQIRQSWQNTQSSILSDEESRNPSVHPEDFPRPPPPAHFECSSIDSENLSQKASLRLVPSTSHSGSSFADQREQFFRERRQDPFQRTPNLARWPSRPSTGIKVPGKTYRSPSLVFSGSSYPDDGVSRQNTQRTQRSYSQSSSVGAGVRSGQYDLTSNPDDWEDVLAETHDADGQRTWSHVTDTPAMASPVVQVHGTGTESDINPLVSWGSRGSRTPGLGALRANLMPTSPGAGSLTVPTDKRLRLGDVKGKRPISVTDSDLPRTQGSQKGNLAFV